MQVPPFWHGADAQSSMLVSHLSPVHPSSQVQIGLLAALTSQLTAVSAQKP
jgi:hypothetical protein